MWDFIKNFIYEHFVDAGYDIVNTITYGLILGLSVFGIIKLINFLKIKIDRNFAVALIPFIFFGATTRVLSDAGFFAGYASDMALTPFMLLYWVVSPGIFVTIFALTICSLVFGILLEKISESKVRYHVPMLLVGSVLAAHNLVFIIRKFYDLILIQNFDGAHALIIFSLFFTASIVFLFLIIKFIKLFDFLKYEKNYLIVSAHLFDAAATFTGVTFFNYQEMHVLPNFLIQIFGGWIMFPLKLAVVTLVIYLIDKSIEDETIRRLIKIVILILGLGPGIRDVGRMIIGV